MSLDPPVGSRMLSGTSGDETEDFLGTGNCTSMCSIS